MLQTCVPITPGLASPVTLTWTSQSSNRRLKSYPGSDHMVTIRWLVGLMNSVFIVRVMIFSWLHRISCCLNALHSCWYLLLPDTMTSVKHESICETGVRRAFSSDTVIVHWVVHVTIESTTYKKNNKTFERERYTRNLWRRKFNWNRLRLLLVSGTYADSWSSLEYADAKWPPRRVHYYSCWFTLKLRQTGFKDAHVALNLFVEDFTGTILSLCDYVHFDKENNKMKVY